MTYLMGTYKYNYFLDDKCITFDHDKQLTDGCNDGLVPQMAYYEKYSSVNCPTGDVDDSPVRISHVLNTCLTNEITETFTKVSSVAMTKFNISGSMTYSAGCNLAQVLPISYDCSAYPTYGYNRGFNVPTLELRYNYTIGYQKIEMSPIVSTWGNNYPLDYQIKAYISGDSPKILAYGCADGCTLDYSEVSQTFTLKIELGQPHIGWVFDPPSSSITMYDNLTLPSITTILGKDNITIQWECLGGVPGETVYSVYFGVPGNPALQMKDFTSNTATFSSLIPSTLYGIVIAATNGNFPSVSIVTNARTSAVQIPNLCTQNCGDFGKCNMTSGSCDCVTGYTGPLCNIVLNETIPIENTNVTTSTTKPTVVLGLGNKSFNFELSGIREVDMDGMVINQANFSTLPWSYSTATNISIQHPVTNQLYIQNEWNYTIYENTTAIVPFKNLSISFIQIKPIVDNNNTGTTGASSFPRQFAGIMLDIPIGAIKYSIDLHSWAFDQRVNTLEFVSLFNTSELQCGEVSLDDTLIVQGQNLSQISIGSTGTRYTGNIVNRGIVDNIFTTIRSRFDIVDGQTYLITQTPYHNDFIQLDPDLSVLVQPNFNGKDGCSPSNESKTSWQLIVGVVVGVVGAAIISRHRISRSIKISMKLRS
ncbi:hypothetical protein DFA_05021 [Cavenderia fasciculata]|uniref:EGF-like domain-containing protein n=1 Tax=Cavenderia fasciculata TaxID=261658 RepID=F4PMZ8_CACFS|nr:uncharacterized protein DFA_05021 [Cavenderia fasciculata]EGG22891.1 hypothetical protein DFA_05021 [Cavenderia fasciculata]|eukprot:XP_004360742.1 hypothetical protein DFA_05021 [Cavenderia fasciculata]